MGNSYLTEYLLLFVLLLWVFPLMEDCYTSSSDIYTYTDTYVCTIFLLVCIANARIRAAESIREDLPAT